MVVANMTENESEPTQNEPRKGVVAEKKEEEITSYTDGASIVYRIGGKHFFHFFIIVSV